MIRDFNYNLLYTRPIKYLQSDTITCTKILKYTDVWGKVKVEIGV